MSGATSIPPWRHAAPAPATSGRAAMSAAPQHGPVTLDGLAPPLPLDRVAERAIAGRRRTDEGPLHAGHLV